MPAPVISPEETIEWHPPVVHTALLFTVMRSTEALIWPEPFADMHPRAWAGHYAEAVTKAPLFDRHEAFFEWDGDSWTINALGHGLLGSELYFRARVCRFGPLGAFAFAAGSTLAWEYAFEANAVRPSALDLVYTPIAGLFFGEMRFAAFQATRGIDSRALRGALRGFLDPLGELERGIGFTRC